MLREINSAIALRHKDKKLVFGEGSKNARLMLIGEAPGKDEVAAGRPFVGKAGENLNSFLNMLGLKRQDIYITNAVKYRPYKISEKGSISNRTPTMKEIFSERDSLLSEINAVSPKLIITLGNIPLRSVTGNKKLCVGDMHGKIIKSDVFPVFSLYHPASIIYNHELKTVYQNDVNILSKIISNINDI